MDNYKWEKDKLQLQKWKMAFKAVGLLYMLPLWLAFLISLVATIVAGMQGISIAFVICLLAAIAFLVFTFVPLFLFYGKFYKLIDVIIKIDDYPIYVITNKLCGDPLEFKDTFHSYLIHTVITAHHVFNSCDFYPKSSTDISESLNGLIVIFVSDIDEKKYWQRWGIKYRRIRGLSMSGKILVEKSILEDISQTACAHEIWHQVEDFFADKLRRAGKYQCVKNSLGLEV